MISFVVYQTKIINNKLTFEFLDSYEEYDSALSVSEEYPNSVVIPFDCEEDDPETYYED